MLRAAGIPVPISSSSWEEGVSGICCDTNGAVDINTTAPKPTNAAATEPNAHWRCRDVMLPLGVRVEFVEAAEDGVEGWRVFVTPHGTVAAVHITTTTVLIYTGFITNHG